MDQDSITLKLRALLIEAALDDLGGSSLEAVTRRLSVGIDQLVVDQLDNVIVSVSDKHPLAADIPFAVIAMGKWGANELNFYSDIDLVFVHEPVAGSETASRSAALALASRLVSDLSSATFDGPALNVDTELRPEGSMGPLSRSLDGYSGYYERWGEAWELQALLKSRFVAGDPELGVRFSELAKSVVWDTGLSTDALRAIRLMKEQVESGASPRDIKRSRGGIRDIEFTIQLLQLVHGRFDSDLRVRDTLGAVRALVAGGYIAPDDGDSLMDSYRFLRTLEHRVQLRSLKQGHEIPEDSESVALIARSMGFSDEADFSEELRRVRSTARDLHERLYFRPILDSLAGVEGLDAQRASLRLQALGFRDVLAATTALTELMSGLSRRSRVMHQALPLMLDWLSQSPDPDLGLSQLRLLLAHSADHSPVVSLLQNNPVAGQRLCTLLGTGRLVGDLIDRIPEFIPRLADDNGLARVRDEPAATQRIVGLLETRPDLDARIGTIRRFVRRRKLRVAGRDILGEASPQVTVASLSDTADSAMKGTLHALLSDDDQFGVVAMGKWGGRELSYGSDIDLFYVNGEGHTERALDIATRISSVLSEPSRHGDGYELDLDLRPEGKKGSRSRAIESFERYYADWVEPWELLALIRARPVAGNPEVLASYMDLHSRVVWVEDFPTEVARAIRTIKARVEAERIPPGEDPDFHLKLGPGGLSDVEFVTGLLQLQHGGRLSSLRVSSTFDAMTALREEELLSTADYRALHDAYLFCTRVRLRLHLQRGRVSDSLPTDPDDTARLAASLGFDRSGELREQYRRYTRRARRVFESLFYE